MKEQELRDLLRRAKEYLDEQNDMDKGKDPEQNILPGLDSLNGWDILPFDDEAENE